MISPMPELVSYGETFTLGCAIILDRDESVSTASDNVSFAAAKMSITDPCAHVKGNRLKIDFFGLGDTKLLQQLFGRGHDAISIQKAEFAQRLKHVENVGVRKFAFFTCRERECRIASMLGQNLLQALSRIREGNWCAR